MKIAYFIYWMDGFESGVFKKITNQIEFWKNKNNIVTLFIYTEEGSKIEYDVNQKKINIPFDIIVITFKGRINQLKNSYKIYNAINDFKPDIIYMRESKFYPGIFKLNKGFPTIVEINSIVTNEVTKKSISYFYNNLMHKKKFKHIKALITVTNEIANHSTLKKISIPKFIIGNGINLKNIKPLKNTHSKQTNLVFIGTDSQKWHGIDKIIRLAKLKPDWIFHIIGITHNKSDLPNTKFHGILNQNEYTTIFAKCNIALGTLALHRKKMQEACPLKTREYLAYGLPVIIAYDDVDFKKEIDFICKLPNIENNIIDNIHKIEKFVLKWKGKRIDRNDINNIDTFGKERLRLDIFKRFI